MKLKIEINVDEVVKALVAGIKINVMSSLNNEDSEFIDEIIIVQNLLDNIKAQIPMDQFKDALSRYKNNKDGSEPIKITIEDD